MNKDQKGDLVEKLMFEVYKDKELGGARIFKARIKEQYGYKVSSDLYAKLVNYQVNKYGEPIYAKRTSDGFDKWRYLKNQNQRKRSKELASRRYQTISFIERAEKDEIKRIKKITNKKDSKRNHN